MSLKQRLNSIEKKLGQADTEYVYCSLPLFFDTTRSPAVYIDRETGDIVPNKEVEKMEDEFRKLNLGKRIVFVQIVIDDSPITDSSE